MILEHISIISFKNISQAHLNFSAGINTLVGANGAGKTNLLDALYYLSMCKSFFGLTDGQSIRNNDEFFMLDARYTTDDQSSENIICSFTRQTKTVKRNGKEYGRLSEHIGLIPIVMVTPSDISLISESGDERRRYLNTFISQIDREYLMALVRYNRTLVERNKLLKEPSNPAFADILAVLDMQLAQNGSIIHLRRNQIAQELAEGTAHYYQILSEGREQVELKYRSELNDHSFEELLISSRERDRICGFTTVGVHRDDLKMTLDGMLLRKFGSQGQQKSFLTALKLAQYDIIYNKMKRKPLLLLDDIFDKLDNNRVERLLSLVSGERFGQIFITDCNEERIDNILTNAGVEYNRFRVIDGEIESY